MIKKFISWNVNGIRAIEKKGFLDFLAQSGGDIVALQETKASPEQLPEKLLSPDGYFSYFDVAERKGYSGTGAYVKEKPLAVRYGLGKDEFDHEGRAVLLEYPNFYFWNIYFPNGGQGEERIAFKLRFYDYFLKRSKELMKQKTLIVCGDVNTAHQPVDLARPKENEKNTGFLPEERAWLNKFFSEGFVDTFRLFTHDGGHYTWWDYKTGARKRNVGWRIDYFMVDAKSAGKVKSSSMLSDVMGSDHCPLQLEIDL